MLSALHAFHTTAAIFYVFQSFSKHQITDELIKARFLLLQEIGVVWELKHFISNRKWDVDSYGGVVWNMKHSGDKADYILIKLKVHELTKKHNLNFVQ